MHTVCNRGKEQGAPPLPFQSEERAGHEGAPPQRPRQTKPTRHTTSRFRCTPYTIAAKSRARPRWRFRARNERGTGARTCRSRDRHTQLVDSNLKIEKESSNSGKGGRGGERVRAGPPRTNKVRPLGERGARGEGEWELREVAGRSRRGSPRINSAEGYRSAPSRTR